MKDIIEAVLKQLEQKALTKSKGYMQAITDFKSLLEIKLKEQATSVIKRNDNLIQQFLNDKKLSGCSEGTIRNYKYELELFKKTVDQSIEKVQDIDIKQYLVTFKSLKNNSLSTKISVLKSFFTYLVEEEIISKNPLRKIKRVKDEKHHPKYLNMEELLRLRESVGDNLRLRTMVEFLFETGCRISEMISIDIDHIDWSNRSIKIRGKGSKERTVFFHTASFYYLKKYLESRTDSCPALFVTRKGEPRRVHVRTVQMELKALGETANLSKNLHPHVMRHTFATHLLNKGMNIATLGDLLGHEQLSTTQIYAKVIEQKKKEEYSRYIA